MHSLMIQSDRIHFRNVSLSPPQTIYLSARLVVMQIHQATGRLFNLTGIHKAPRELDAILDVSRAASPLPALLLIVVALLLPVTAALAQVALAASGCDCMGHPCCCDGIGESCFPTA